jgi:nucleotide-binding universal stress UspA family protein
MQFDARASVYGKVWAGEGDRKVVVTEQAGLWCDPTYIVEQGVAAEKILDVRKRRHTDLIVEGARSEKGPATHLNIGTVHKVVSRAKCPVLTVSG